MPQFSVTGVSICPALERKVILFDNTDLSSFKREFESILESKIHVPFFLLKEFVTSHCTSKQPISFLLR